MNKIRLYPCLAPLFASLIPLVMGSCSADDTWQPQTGGLRVALSDNVAVETRNTPAQIGAPVDARFNLDIVNDKTGETLYDGDYTSDYISAPAGDYTLEATCGDNPVLAYDDPYYVGTATATVGQNGLTTVTIPCKVANCLLTVEFTNPEAFDALYSYYGVMATVGQHSLILTPDTGSKSVYFQDGSTVSLIFFATMKDTDDGAVSMEITSDDLPGTYQAGTHTKLSLTSNAQTSGAGLTRSERESGTRLSGSDSPIGLAVQTCAVR